MTRRRLGQLEAEVLAALATAERPVATSELRDALSGAPAYTTVNTILFRLLGKGLVSRMREGRHFLYKLAVDESRLVADQMHDRLRVASDPPEVLARFVATLSREEALTLRAILATPGEVPAAPGEILATPTDEAAFDRPVTEQAPVAAPVGERLDLK
ncbi:BlaI/MecI/CopY family transcriptional regulator [Actinomadura harenae]|uniref:BlaI/MecI/CopY family transcriptional regulator n=1 Tax=Actinomadura harenae TaxID=2483351 RepID=A0A3M2MF10_9ACTN|nr:BlaI/MecI/CopY family transcriptional regulator [Actinomadura harenae]RMI47463.1 BlaI/MecI/CopY family transcriptional regulator [Actinomadura harenae]